MQMFDASTLARKARLGSIWTGVGFVSGHVLRLGSNLVLTRLLYPDVFGMMALVSIFMHGLSMFSDVGIGPSIIRSKRGDDPDFLNTAWTIQVLRGVILFLASCALAWPVSNFYGEPMLAKLLPITGISAILNGLNSTKLATANRHMFFGRLTAMELITQGVCLSSTVAMAWLMQSVWALVIGYILSSGLKTLLSHFFLPGPINSLCWNGAALEELIRFGKWIFVSTLMTFVSQSADKLVLGKMLNAKELGVYTLAFSLIMIPQELVRQVCSRVMLPLYRHGSNSTHDLSAATNMRRLIAAIGGTVAIAFLLSGEAIVRFLYDPRYYAAGHLVQVLSVGLMFGTFTSSVSPWLLAKGQSRRFAFVQGSGCISMTFASIWLGQLYGAIGIAWAVVITRAVVYLVTTAAVWDGNIMSPKEDLIGFAAVLAFAAIMMSGW